MRLGAVHLTVADLERSIAYYERALRLRVHERDGGRAALGAGAGDLLVLTEEPGAQPNRGFSGLFHFALLVPERADLAGYLAYVAEERVPLTGLSDHRVSEALYLRDPDGHGIEVYADRPRESWEGRVSELMTTIALDTDDLLAAADGRFDAMPEGTVMGHVHLCVSDIPSTVAFYRDELGLELMAHLGAQAAFLSDGGYHHHIGANTWQSAGRGQPPPGTATLTQVTILGDRDERLTDPSGNPLALVRP